MPKNSFWEEYTSTISPSFTSPFIFFIAPENFIGIQDPNKKTHCENGREIDLDSHVLCVNGAVFEKRMSPTLMMLKDVYADRKKAKKVMMDKKEELKSILDEIKELEVEI